MKLIGFVFVFFALALAAIAQQPLCSASLPAASGGMNPVMFSDWSHNQRMLVVYANSIVPVSVPDCTVGNPIPLPVTIVPAYGGSTIGACSDSATGMVATVTAVNQATVIQVVDSTTGQGKSFEPPISQFVYGGGCAFAGGLLYAGQGISTTYLGNSSLIIAIDPTTMAVVSTWNPIGVGNLLSLAGSPSGKVYALSQNLNQACPFSYNCTTELDVLNSDGTYATLSQWALPDGYGTMPISVSPNGDVYANGVVYQQQDSQLSLPQETPGAKALGTGSCGAAWPSSDPLWVYCYNGGVHKQVVGLNLATGLTPLTLATTYAYSSISAQRQSDGTDLVAALRSGFLDVYQVTPPATLYGIADAASLQLGSSLAPGSLVTVLGQGLGAWDESDTADTADGVTKVGNTQVLLYGTALRLLYVGYGQINTELTQSGWRDGGQGFTVSVGPTTLDAYFTVVDQAVKAFMWTPQQALASPAPAPIITNAAYQLIGPPALVTAKVVGAGSGIVYPQAAENDTVTIWATGGGKTIPAYDDSVAIVPSAPLFWLAITPQVLIDGIPAAVTYAGLVPGCVPGLNQINVIVPAGLPSGAHDLTINSLGATPSSVTYKGSFWTK